GRDIVAECRSRRIAAQSGDSQLVHAGRINKRIRPRLRKVRLDIADVAIAVAPRAQEFTPQPHVDRESLRGLPIILRKDRRIALPVSMVINTAAAKTESWRAANEVAKVGSGNVCH